MSQQKKFGTFAGVFTPSILTILGVIMYMRMGSIVGNSSGIWMTLSIILFAHIVSITTGLSVSSIATDKKIKAGGIYYMLTRSLGFPIGGAIGVTLFIATALSIALYLIGFGESILITLNALDIEWLNLGEITTNQLRFTGAMALLLVVGTALYSTSLAIKMQFVILGLIILSLFSIGLGSAEGIKPGTDHLKDVGFATLFGIFFPAVTGFTAGVAMSGDLKDPKKSIPWGTMLAVGVGLVVYIVLAIILDARIPKEILSTNNNAIVEYALGGIFFVTLGIWGATLSSALGGILGAPRILQAMSEDKITPRIFGKGVGVNNEPRNALILTAIIAFGGIMIGELNAIAEAVAMCYMAAYLFINVSCFLEQWASPDFRPSFRISLLIPLVGAIATLLLMIQLNLVASIASVLFMAIIFIWLAKKQLELGSGDVWNSVWSSIVKIGLKNLQKKSTHKRNWEPNILLFTGESSRREELITISKSIAGRNGMISNFNLVLNESAKVLFPKHQQTIPLEDDDGTIFYRQQECKNIYRGIENIANTYGFSGIDPNTVLLGWNKNTLRPGEFGHMTNYLTQLDYNILFLDYDENRKWGKQENIHIWWTQFNEYCELSLQIAKLVLSSPEWSNSKITVLFKNQDNSTAEYIRKVIEHKLENARITAEINIVNNELEQKSLYDLVKLTSNDSDLNLLELPWFDELGEAEFITKTSALLPEIGTALIIRASSHFYEDLNLDPALQKEYEQIQSRLNFLEEAVVIELHTTGIEPIDDFAEVFSMRLKESHDELNNTILKAFEEVYLGLVNVIEQSKNDKTYNTERKVLIIEDFKKYRTEYLGEVIEKSIKRHFNVVTGVLKNVPSELSYSFPSEKLIIKPSDSKVLTKSKKRLKKNSGEHTAKLAVMVNHFAQTTYLPNFDKLLNVTGITGFVMNNIMVKWLATDGENTESLRTNIEEQLLKEAKISTDQSGQLINNFIEDLSNSLADPKIKVIQDDIEEDQSGNEPKEIVQSLVNLGDHFADNQRLLGNNMFNGLAVKTVLKTGKQYLDVVKRNVLLRVKENYLKDLALAEKTYLENDSELLNNLKYFEQLASISLQINARVTESLSKFPDEIKLMASDSINNFEQDQIRTKVVNVNFKQAIKFIIDNEYISSLIKKLQPVVSNFNKDISNYNKVVNLVNHVRSHSAGYEDQDLDELSLKLKNATLVLKENLAHHSDALRRILEESKSDLDRIITIDNLLAKSTFAEKSYSRDQAASKANKYLNKTRSRIKKMTDALDSKIVDFRDTVNKSSFEYKTRGLLNEQTKLAEISKQYHPSKTLQFTLPVFYKQLFEQGVMEKDNSIEFGLKEISNLVSAIKRNLEGKTGSILITGEVSCGKSYIANRAIEEINPAQSLIINCSELPTLSSINDLFKQASGIEADAEEILSNYPNGSIIMIRDISILANIYNDDKSIFQELIELMNKHNGRLVFLLDCNIHFYQYAKNLLNFDQSLLQVVIVYPQGIKTFKSVFLNKHVNSGMYFSWQNLNEVDFKPRHFNKLFTKLTSVSMGNIGFASKLWLANIKQIEQNTLVLGNFDQDAINFKLAPDWEILIYQLLLYQEISEQSLEMLFDNSMPSYKKTLEGLVRAEVVKKNMHGRYEIEPYLMLPLIKYFKQNQLVIG